MMVADKGEKWVMGLKNGKVVFLSFLILIKLNLMKFSSDHFLAFLAAINPKPKIKNSKIRMEKQQKR